jgi:mRNA interferase RelE/StbE
MSYKLALSKSSLKFLEDLPAKQFRQVVSKVFTLLQNPNPSDSKKLIGYEEYFRVDVGEYRVIYWVSEGVVNIDLIGKRNDNEVYKQFERKMH